jgi:hypothetical protein
LFRLFTFNASTHVTSYILIKVSCISLLVLRGNWREQPVGFQHNHIIYNAFHYHIIRDSNAEFIGIVAIGYHEKL